MAASQFPTKRSWHRKFVRESAICYVRLSCINAVHHPTYSANVERYSTVVTTHKVAFRGNGWIKTWSPRSRAKAINMIIYHADVFVIGAAVIVVNVGVSIINNVAWHLFNTIPHCRADVVHPARPWDRQGTRDVWNFLTFLYKNFLNTVIDHEIKICKYVFKSTFELKLPYKYANIFIVLRTT